MLQGILVNSAARRLVLCAALLLSPCGLAARRAAAQVSTPPRFTVELRPVAASNLPALHSFSLGKGSDGKWLLVGGRTNGLHAFVQSSDGGQTPPPNAFPVASANRSVWVIDPAARRAWSASLDGLGTQIADALSATNAESAQEGNTLYIVGGYGWDSRKQTMTTFGALHAIQVDEAIKTVIDKTTLVPYVQQTNTFYDCPLFGSNAYNACVGDPNTGTRSCKQGPGWAACVKKVQAACRVQRDRATAACATCVTNNQFNCTWAGKSVPVPTNTGFYTKVTGGGMEKLGSAFYLVFGQQFEGLYSVLEGDYGKWPVSQTYTERVAALSITPNPLTASVLNVYLQDANDLAAQYHRRDLNVVSAIRPDGPPRIVAHGGVFVPGQDSAYRQPVFIDMGANPLSAKVTVDKYQQVMSQYDCAVLRMYDRSGGPKAGRMINVFFGGISLYYLDPKTGKLKLDSGLPFIGSLTSLTLNPDGSWSEFIRRAQLPGLMGTDAKFVALSNVPASPQGVIYVDALKQNTLVGYVYGGILARQAKAQDPSETTSSYTSASNALYEVWVNTAPPPAGYWVSTVSAATGTATGGSVSGTNRHPVSNVLNESVSKPTTQPSTQPTTGQPTTTRRPGRKP
ncbi:MAG TPA: hypothetical protein VF297_01555 [Pyrinomonadaceae bacterium]